MTAINQILRWLPATVTDRRRAGVAIAGLGVITGLAVGPAVADAGDPADTGASAAPVVSAGPLAPAVAAVTPAAPTPPAPASKALDHRFQFQPNYYYCGPAATRIALTAHGVQPSQDDLAKRLGTTTNGTDSAEDVTRVLNSVGRTDFYRTKSIPGASASTAETDRLTSDVARAVSGGHPVVANIAGAAKDTDGTVHSYPGGHYLTVVGYRDNGKAVQIADPADTAGGGSYWMTTTNLADWIATRGYSA